MPVLSLSICLIKWNLPSALPEILSLLSKMLPITWLSSVVVSHRWAAEVLHTALSPPSKGKAGEKRVEKDSRVDLRERQMTDIFQSWS